MKRTPLFPEIITPKSYPERLMAVDYDPYRVMPAVFPVRPYLQATVSQVRMVRARMKAGAWHRAAFERIRQAAAAEPPAVDERQPNGAAMLKLALTALDKALVGHVDGNSSARQTALEALRLLARIYPALPVRPGSGRVPGAGDFGESHFIARTAKAYDLLAADGISPADETLFRNFLKATAAASDACGHRHCNNHHTGALSGRLTAALALQDRQAIHDTLYGHPVEGGWSYGLLHQLRHEFLADGLQWERSISYHAYTLTHFVEMLDLLLNVGVDLWHAQLPPLWQNDGHDEHRDYGREPEEFRAFRATFEILLYLAFPNGQLSMIGDSNFGAIQGISQACGTLFERAWEVYRDPRFAWLIRRVEAEAPDIPPRLPGLPIALILSGGRDLFRVARTRLPRAKFDLNRPVRIAFSGEHRRGCSSFNAMGATLLRARGDDLQAPAAYVFWGPVSAGHQAPGPLHLELYGGGALRTPAPRAGTWNFDDPLFLPWHRTTLAHNTVTVDQTPAFPYDGDTGSMWEADTWRDRISDGERVRFDPDGAAFKAMRLRNRRVYPGVTLDRTVIVTPRLALDVFRCYSAAVHTYDWAMHVIGTPAHLGDGAHVPPLKGRGYDKLQDVRRVPVGRNGIDLAWEAPEGITRAAFRASGRPMAFLGRDPVSSFRAVGQTAPAGVRHTVVVRSRGREALFVSAWTFDGAPVAIDRLTGAARTPVQVRLRDGRRVLNWRIPFADDQPVQSGGKTP